MANGPVRGRRLEHVNAELSADRSAPGLGAAIARYGLARAGLVAAVTAMLVLVGVPLLVALLIALLASLPLSMVLFKPLRRDLDQALAATTARRNAQKARLRAQLRGEEPPLGQDEEREADGGADRPGEQGEGGGAENRNERLTPRAAQDLPNRPEGERRGE